VAKPTDNVCACGCGARCVRKWKRGHNNQRLIETSYDLADTGYETPCWIWNRIIDDSGYGRCLFRGRPTAKAHRVVYELHRGPIPKGRVLDHLCAMPACVNPDHLESVTQAENIARGYRRERRLWGSLTLTLVEALDRLEALGQDVSAGRAVVRGVRHRAELNPRWRKRAAA
jgi:hypothetical protein